MNYNYHHRKIIKKFEGKTDEFTKLFSDSEIKILLLWAIIGPFCALGYIVWLKYPKLRLLSLIFFLANMIYFVGQLGGILYILPKANIILSRLFV
ncbi:MAG: hypothetical protein KJ697_00260 [Nanoarchaeota archaeon]|nr:hypothetical protein [Nanoarchaeota archaeon]MBU4124250.1 hypothetical protein [Nanoarchaeota archaeon]